MVEATDELIAIADLSNHGISLVRFPCYSSLILEIQSHGAEAG